MHKLSYSFGLPSMNVNWTIAPICRGRSTKNVKDLKEVEAGQNLQSVDTAATASLQGVLTFLGQYRQGTLYKQCAT